MKKCFFILLALGLVFFIGYSANTRVETSDQPALPADAVQIDSPVDGVELYFKKSEEFDQLRGYETFRRLYIVDKGELISTVYVTVTDGARVEEVLPSTIIVRATSTELLSGVETPPYYFWIISRNDGAAEREESERYKWMLDHDFDFNVMTADTSDF